MSVCFFIFFQGVTISNAQQFKWVKGGGSTEDMTGTPAVYNEQVDYICTDINGNIYAASQVGDNHIIADTFLKSSVISQGNILITSYTCDGQMRWAKLIYSSGGDCISYGIVTDNIGHVYLAGYLTNGVLHIGNDTTISGLIYQSEGLIQFDTSGHFNWVRYVGNNTIATEIGALSYGSTVGIDGGNNVHFFNSMKYGVPVTPSVMSHSGMYDLAYNSSGMLLSAKHLMIDSTLVIFGGALDRESGKFYAYGYRNTAFVPDSSYSPYLAAFDTARNLIWKDTLGGPYGGGSTGITGAVTDGYGNLYLSGLSPGYVTYNGVTVTPVVGGQLFVMKTDTNGNLKWLTHFDSPHFINCWGVTLASTNKVAAAGIMSGNVISGSDTTYWNYMEGQNAFVPIVDTSGTLVSVQQIHGNGFYDGATAITSDKIGNLYIGGYLSDSIWAGTPPIPAYHTVGGNTDFFVMKYGVDCSCTAAPFASYTDTGTHTIGVTYTGTTVGLDSVVWTFGDGHTATGTAALHTYSISGTYHVCVTVYTECGNDTHCSDVVIHIPSEVTTVLSKGEIKVFPNPANDALNVTGLWENTSYRLLSVTGMSLQQGLLQQGSSTISMKDFAAGVYILELNGENGERTIVRVVKE